MNENKIISSDILKLLDDFSDWYISKFNFDHPIKDAAQIITIILIAKNNNGCEIDLPEFPEKGSSCLIDYISDYAFDVYPNLGRDGWKYLLKKILTIKYGGEKFYIKSNPAAELKKTAKSMTAPELMSKFGISRGYAYKLRSAALKRKS